jgi:hypothetical protein
MARMTKETLKAELQRCVDESKLGDFEQAHGDATDALLAYINDKEVTALFNSGRFYCA